MSPIDIDTPEVLFTIHPELPESGKKATPTQKLERRRRIEEILEERSLKAEFADF